MKIPKFRLEYDEEFIERFTDGCKEILKCSMLTNASNVKLFEEKFAKFIGTKYAVAVNSGTGALEVALRAVDAEDKAVIISDNTMAAQAMAVERAGAFFFPADIELKTFSISPIFLSHAVGKTIKILILTHIGGLISNKIKEIKRICKENNILLIEDAAHAHGSKNAGKLGEIGCFSFFPTKVMTTGEGGMLTTDNEELYEIIKVIRNFGRVEGRDWIHLIDSGNFKMTEFQGLLGCLELERVEKRIKKRQHIASLYNKNLDKELYSVATQRGCSYYKTIVKLVKPELSKVRHLCKSNGISLTGQVYRLPIHKQPIYEGMFKDSLYPATNHFSKNHICPPCYPELNDWEVEYVCEVLSQLPTD